MPRRRYPARRRRYADDYDDAFYQSRRRRGGCLAPIRRFFRNVVIVIMLVLATILLFCLVLLIAFNFTTFVGLLLYALYVGAGLAILGVLYLVVRLLAAISHRISEASLARSQARIQRERVRIEKERVQQARIQVKKGSVQVLSQEAKFHREYPAFSQYDEHPGALPHPRRTRTLRDDPSHDLSLRRQGHAPVQSPYRTRNLREMNQELLVRLLPALSPLPPAEPPAVEETELEHLGMPKKGQVFAYRMYSHLLAPGQLFLGMRKDGSPRIGTWQDLKITLVLGTSSSGKSTTVLEKCVGHVKDGGLLIICDPGGFKPDSLMQRMGPLQQALLPGTRLALEHEDIMQNLECFRVELERRRRGASMDLPILLVVDELNGLLMDKAIKKELTDLLEQFAQQARNYRLSLILCAQRASGLAALRNSVISYICHKCPEMEAEKILPARYAKYAPQLGVGQTFVMDANGEIEPLQQLLITPADIAASVGSIQASSKRGMGLQREPRVPRTEAVRHPTPTPPAQNVRLHRTTLVQAPQPSSATEQTSVAQPAPTNPTPRTGAIWGEARQPHLPADLPPVPPPQPSPITEHLVPKTPEAADASATIPRPQQDTFEMLALQRAKKRK